MAKRVCRRRIDGNNLSDKSWIHILCEDGERDGSVCCDYVRTLADDIVYKIGDKLYIHIICVSKKRFFRPATAQKVDGVNGVFFFKFFYNTAPFIGGTYRIQIMDQENGCSLTASAVKDPAVFPVIKRPVHRF